MSSIFEAAFIDAINNGYSLEFLVTRKNEIVIHLSKNKRHIYETIYFEDTSTLSEASSSAIKRLRCELAEEFRL